MANAPMSGADAYRFRLHDRHNDGRNACSLRAADAIPNHRHKAVRVSAAGLLKVCTPIYRGDSGGRRSQLALMPLAAGIRERCARDRSPPGPRRREAARFTRARRAGLPARAPDVRDNSDGRFPHFRKTNVGSNARFSLGYTATP